MIPASLAINARRFAQDTRAVAWSNQDWFYLLDEAAKLLQSELKPLKNRTTLSTVKNQQVYALASNVMTPVEVEFSDGGNMWKIAGRSLDEFRLQRLPILGSRPYFYTYFDDEQSIALAPVPSAAADTTTLTGAHTSTVTTITVASTSKFVSQGRVIIDTEVIDYTGTTSTTLTGATRGVEGTTAAAHSDAVTVTERDLYIYAVRRYTDREMVHYYTTGNVNVTNASATVSGGSSAPSWTNNVSAGDYLGITANATNIDPTVWYKISTVDTATQVTLSTNYNEPTATNQTYIISSPNPFPNQYDGFFRAYLQARALEKEGDLKGAMTQWQMVERMLKSVRAGRNKPDTPLYPRGRHDHTRRPSGRMPVSGGSTYDTVG